MPAIFRASLLGAAAVTMCHAAPANTSGPRGAPPNDACGNSITVGIGSVTFGDTVGATADGAPLCTPSSPNGVWFDFIGDGSTLTIATCGAGTDFDTVLQIYTGDCTAMDCFASNDDLCGIQSSVTASYNADVHYWVLLTGAGPGQGSFQLTISSGGDCNQNGIGDTQDIDAGTSRDCFDSEAPQTPGGPYAAGGANGVPDECECVADWNRDGVANSADVGEHINTYFFDQSTGLTTFADVDCNGISNSADVGEFINLYFAAQAAQLPFAACTL